MASSAEPPDDGDICQQPAHFFEAITGEIFTFIVGVEKKRYTIHVSAFKALSEPLSFMMTNGKMEESIRKEAVLSDVEPAVFEQLAKYAYKGLCGVSDGMSAIVMNSLVQVPYSCHACNAANSEPNFYPFCNKGCKNTYGQRSTNLRQAIFNYTAYCVVRACTAQWSLDGSGRLLCSTHLPKNVEQYGSMNSKNEAELPKKQDSRCSDEFTDESYGTKTKHHDELSNHISSHLARPAPTMPLDTHAKLYVLANKYLIDELQYISLHKLHRALCVFEIEDESIDDVIDLVLYTYSNTSDTGDILKSTADMCRELVIKYVVDRVKQLMRYESFRGMLAAGGSQTADFMALMFAEK